MTYFSNQSDTRFSETASNLSSNMSGNVRPLMTGAKGTGLVLSAGGARGAYHIGAWRAFQEKGLRFDAFSGSSIGALNSALVCQGDWDKAYRLWIEMPTISIVKPDAERLARFLLTMATDVGLMLLPIPNLRLLRMLKPVLVGIKIASRYGFAGAFAREGLIDMLSFQPFISQFLDMKKVVDCRQPVFSCVYEAPRAFKPLGHTRHIRLQELSADQAWAVLAASASLPLIFSTVGIDNIPYIDGGLGSWMPIEPLMKRQLDQIWAVSTSAGYKPRHFHKVAHSTRLKVLQPQKSLGRFPVATFGFTRDNIERWIETGYTETRNSL